MHKASKANMSRPNIVRAGKRDGLKQRDAIAKMSSDTIDLQDQDNPTAAEHQKHPNQARLAPHQAAEVHHVLEERHSEEQALSDAWNISGTGEPGAIDDAQANGNREQGTNGASHEGENGGEGGESEGDGDDDMMDRISSSPSIDDGGYILHSSLPPSAQRAAALRWPARSSSMSPTPPRSVSGDFNSSASSASTLDSSPFLRTPPHLPLHVGRASKEASPLSQAMIEESSSPFEESTLHYPALRVHSVDRAASPLSRHHHMGRYGLQAVDESGQDDSHDDDEGFFDDQDDANETSSEDETAHSTHPAIISPTRRTIESPFRQHSLTRSMADLQEPHLKQSPSLTSIGSVDLQDVLLPLDDPLLDPAPSPSSSSDSWESLANSEAESLAKDDDADDLFLDLDERFIDSGWGGECLRDTEDIDFEFVYALHTFVATVEGQANATKGDTMVLLDDSNSYWWLVRVVKDSSIGQYCAIRVHWTSG